MEPLNLNRPFRIGDWRVDPTLDELRREGQHVKVEPRIMRLLCCLASRPGEVFFADELLDRVWVCKRDSAGTRRPWFRLPLAAGQVIAEERVCLKMPGASRMPSLRISRASARKSQFRRDSRAFVTHGAATR